VSSAEPEIRYARSGDVHVAYYVVGEGPLDIVFVHGALTNLKVLREEPGIRRFYERLASFSRLIMFDKRGMGLSDHVSVGSLEERMDDIRAVMDAVGSERAALIGMSEGGPLSMLFAATYPERTEALLLVGAEVKEEETEDWPWGEATRESFETGMETLPERWGKSGANVTYFIPSAGNDPRLQDWWRRLMVESASPGTAIAFMRMAFEIDVRDIVASIRVPTLILHRQGDHVCHVENARYLAKRIPGARYLELDGDDHIPWGQNGDEIASEIQEFLTGARESPTPDRVLATVLFTDLVGSTERAVAVGDRRWAGLLETHHAAVRRELARFRGREIDTAGDGFLASFDGPARAIRCASAAIDSVRGLGLEIRAGVHTGECEVVGEKLGGIAVHIGARVAAKANAGEILVSGTVKDLVAGSGIAFEDRGVAELKGVPGSWPLYAVA
jgi:pimeloyl-ACP methyl ester carboxylesterase